MQTSACETESEKVSERIRLKNYLKYFLKYNSNNVNDTDDIVNDISKSVATEPHALCTQWEKYLQKYYLFH